MGRVRYTGAEHEGLWARMSSGDSEGEEKVKELKEDNHPPPSPPKAKPPPPKPPATKSGGKKIPRMHFEWDDSSDAILPPSKTKKSPPQAPPPHTIQATRPQDPPPKRGGVPTTPKSTHRQRPRPVFTGLAGGHHARCPLEEGGVVWREYPDNPPLSEVARNLLFPSPEAAHEYLEPVCKPEGKATRPPHCLRASLTRRLTPDKPQDQPPHSPQD